MGIFDLMNINYKQIFNGIMQSDEAQSLMADFINHCLLHCGETQEIMINLLENNENFNRIIDNSIDRVIKKSKIKSEYFN